MGLATAVNRLKDSKAKSKIVILLTDGVNNAGSYWARNSCRYRKTVWYVHTGLGSNGMAESPMLRANGQLLFKWWK
jgi:Ca-activated chloride channel family protein